MLCTEESKEEDAEVHEQVAEVGEKSVDETAKTETKPKMMQKGRTLLK